MNYMSQRFVYVMCIDVHTCPCWKNILVKKSSVVVFVRKCAISKFVLAGDQLLECTSQFF